MLTESKKSTATTFFKEEDCARKLAVKLLLSTVCDAFANRKLFNNTGALRNVSITRQQTDESYGGLEILL